MQASQCVALTQHDPPAITQRYQLTRQFKWPYPTTPLSGYITAVYIYETRKLFATLVIFKGPHTTMLITWSVSVFNIAIIIWHATAGYPRINQPIANGNMVPLLGRARNISYKHLGQNDASWCPECMGHQQSRFWLYECSFVCYVFPNCAVAISRIGMECLWIILFHPIDYISF